MNTYLFHGPSGCGKDTQVDLLLKEYPGKLERIATGEMFRKMYEEGDSDGLDAYKYWSKGIFNPDEQVYKMLGKWLERFDPKKDWIFVSAVRRAGQISLFDDVLRKYNRTLTTFVHFKLNLEAVLERRTLRWVCPECQKNYHKKYNPEKNKGFCDIDNARLFQREDDTKEASEKLFEQYNETIKPILDEYQRRNILIEIDASPDIETIHNEVVKRLDI